MRGRERRLDVLDVCISRRYLSDGQQVALQGED